MDQTQKVFEDGFTLDIDHSTKAAEKNPDQWTVRGVMQIDLTGMTFGDLLNIIQKPLKISVQGGSRMQERDKAVAHLNRKMHWTEVGKVPMDPTKAREAYKARLLTMSKEERLAELKKEFGEMMEE